MCRITLSYKTAEIRQAEGRVGKERETGGGSAGSALGQGKAHGDRRDPVRCSDADALIETLAQHGHDLVGLALADRDLTEEVHGNRRGSGISGPVGDAHGSFRLGAALAQLSGSKRGVGPEDVNPRRLLFAQGEIRWGARRGDRGLTRR